MSSSEEGPGYLVFLGLRCPTHRTGITSPPFMVIINRKQDRVWTFSSVSA